MASRSATMRRGLGLPSFSSTREDIKVKYSMRKITVKNKTASAPRCQPGLPVKRFNLFTSNSRMRLAQLIVITPLFRTHHKHGLFFALKDVAQHLYLSYKQRQCRGYLLKSLALAP